jgi:aminopeptidase-like protein
MDVAPDLSSRKFLDALFDELFPILRSITGPGLQKSIGIMARYMPLNMSLVPTGTQVFDWEVPPEWHLKSARLTGPDGTVIADADVFNLHVLNYSEPVDATLPLAELEKHLHSIPELPDAVPYVTSYYKRRWGFCIADKLRRSLKPGSYHAKIDSSFPRGGVPVADCFLAGESTREIMLSSYLCHPSLANNELSGPLVLLGLYHRVKAWPRRRFTYRFVINPETIGSLCYLHLHGEALRKNLHAGLILTCVGGREKLSYKKSRRGDSVLDRLVEAEGVKRAIRVRKFDPRSGSDERQYCSPGFNLPVGQMARTVYNEYPGYHNSLDNKAFMSVDALVASINEIESLLKTAEIAGCFVNQSPYGEPQLGKRDLYPNINSAATAQYSNDGVIDARTFLNHLLTILNYSDGQHAMLDIAAMLETEVEALRPVVEKLEAVGLLKPAGHEPGCHPSS